MKPLIATIALLLPACLAELEPVEGAQDAGSDAKPEKTKPPTVMVCQDGGVRC